MEHGWRSGYALASHLCVPGSILAVSCGLSLLLVLALLRGFFSGFSGFLPPHKPTLLNSNSIWTSVLATDCLNIDYYYYCFADELTEERSENSTISMQNLKKINKQGRGDSNVQRSLRNKIVGRREFQNEDSYCRWWTKEMALQGGGGGRVTLDFRMFMASREMLHKIHYYLPVIVAHINVHHRTCGHLTLFWSGRRRNLPHCFANAVSLRCSLINAIIHCCLKWRSSCDLPRLTGGREGREGNGDFIPYPFPSAVLPQQPPCK